MGHFLSGEAWRLSVYIVFQQWKINQGRQHLPAAPSPGKTAPQGFSPLRIALLPILCGLPMGLKSTTVQALSVTIQTQFCRVLFLEELKWRDSKGPFSPIIKLFIVMQLSLYSDTSIVLLVQIWTLKFINVFNFYGFQTWMIKSGHISIFFWLTMSWALVSQILW